MKNKVAAALAVVCLIPLGLSAQDKAMKPWAEWSKKDAEKILNNSPWGQTQEVTDTSEMFYSPTATPTSGRASSSRAAEGAVNQAAGVKFRIRFFSARPIRQALVRSMILSMPKKPDDATAERLRQFAELQSNDSIIIAVTFESADGRYGGPVMQAFNSATTDFLKNSTYLERKDGKRLFLSEYAVPGRDGFGARFIFPRELDGKPFITPDTGEVRFVSQVGRGIELNMRFKTAQMNYNDALEY